MFIEKKLENTPKSNLDNPEMHFTKYFYSKTYYPPIFGKIGHLEQHI